MRVSFKLLGHRNYFGIPENFKRKKTGMANKRIAIVGGGASGMIAAIAAARPDGPAPTIIRSRMRSMNLLKGTGTGIVPWIRPSAHESPIRGIRRKGTRKSCRGADL